MALNVVLLETACKSAGSVSVDIPKALLSLAVEALCAYDKNEVVGSATKAVCGFVVDDTTLAAFNAELGNHPEFRAINKVAEDAALTSNYKNYVSIKSFTPSAQVHP